MAILTPLAASPEIIASWPTPNYVNPDTRGPALIYVCIIFSAIGVILCAARAYSRLFITRAPGVDDILIVCGLVAGIALSVMVIIGNKTYFSGRHVWDIPVSKFAGHRLNVWIAMWCFITASTFTKISVLLFYRRLSVKFSKAFLIATWVGIVYNVVYMLAFFMTLLLICDPVYAYWQSFDPVWATTHEFRCNTEGLSLPASAGLSVLGDLYSTLIPVFLIYNLDLPRRQKLALYSLFALGFLAVAAGIVRTVLLYQLLNSDFDFTWILWETWIWAVVELYVAIWAACAPALKPFFQKYFVESIESITKNKGDAVWYPSLRGSRGKTLSEDSSNLHDSVVMGNIGVAHSGTGEELRQRGFLKDIGNQETRNFQMRKSADGKMIPMQVYRAMQTEPPESLPSNDFTPAHNSTSSYQWTENWPMPPSKTGTPASWPDSKSRGSQQTIHVGLQLDPSMEPFNIPRSSQGSVAMENRRVQQHKNHSYEYGSGLNPGPFKDMHDGLGSSSRLESPSDSDEASVYADEKPPWNTIRTSSSIVKTERSTSDETLHLPRMGSRDLDPENRSAVRPGAPAGYAI
ncbi:uncharacterized protein A1O9_03521 [Exophiala aquamarina CBS 119918]|uniref:Rhodopsin domain-containing protein n=1 Tax=Exophiala aquamarina CBS 119918 TaxID=1182545 RepID=A0A072PPB7_9EURO|nr:uncharacterized protein A1O9_03521 [Exophiala aquamarina CBS 119918]KEF61949.1 hypothetical protein A1O9_03521 [Exophiala aquamarina CBS 119918]